MKTHAEVAKQGCCAHSMTFDNRCLNCGWQGAPLLSEHAVRNTHDYPIHLQKRRFPASPVSKTELVFNRKTDNGHGDIYDLIRDEAN